MPSSLPVTRTPCYSFRQSFRFRTQLIPVFIATLFFLFAPHLQTQSTFGSILGTVQDASGAVVPGATVTTVNTGTTAQRVVTSDASGDFTFSNIEIGHYSLTVTAAGFEKYSLPEIEIT